MLVLEKISKITKCEKLGGYKIEFYDNTFINLQKRRTIAGLLLLIKYEYCSEADLAGANTRLAEVKELLKGKIDPTWIQDRYGDANKPFSELWTEEGFSCIKAEGMKGNRQYVLHTEDHHLLFSTSAKAPRLNLNSVLKATILEEQNELCNICGAKLISGKLPAHTFSKDRAKLEFDHRIPVDRGGETNLNNMQALCHYCNKSKRQQCFICTLTECSPECALVSPENYSIVMATEENIADRITRNKIRMH